MTEEQIAELCHAVNAAYCRLLGDASQPSWEQAPQWMRESALDGVRFHLRNPRAAPSASHYNWMRTKLAEGWRYGPVKDPERKEHPCLVAFGLLPPEQQAKDALFTYTVRALAPLLEA